jgi:YVTN family beta-propeller protein
MQKGEPTAVGALGTNPRIGRELAGYRLEALVGRGGMGVVYRAYDLALERPVALKILAPELAEDEHFRERFLTESRLAASIDHPNIIPVYDAGEVAGELYIAMRYVDGSDLKKLLADGPLPAERAIAVVSHVAGALDAAHERGLVHRDIKPSNVLIDERGHVYLADFGLSRRLGEPGAALGATQSLGTIDYVAPEQIRGEHVDGRADLYSLGCLLHECLTGKPPFARATDSAVLFAHLEEEPPAAPGLEDVMRTALAKEPDDRFQTGYELVEAARQALGIAEPRRSRWPLAVAAIGVALIAAALAAFFLTHGGGTASTATGRLLRIDPATNSVTGAIRVGAQPTGVALGRGHVWISTAGDGRVWNVDTKTLAASNHLVEESPLGVAVHGNVVYVAAGTIVPTSVTRLDAVSGARLDAIRVDGISAISGGDSGVWIGAFDLEALSSGSAPGRVTEHVSIQNPVPEDAAHVRLNFEGLAVGERSVWAIGDALDPRLWRIDPASGRVVSALRLPFVPSSVAVVAGAVWVAAELDDLVARVDSTGTRIVETIPVGREPSSIAGDAGAVWVSNTIDGTLSRIDPRADSVVATIALGSHPRRVAVGDGSVWVATDAG